MIRRRLEITGRVQGVFYRAWLQEQAVALGIDGWVRNRADGSVEAVVQGPPDAVAQIVERARAGPPLARVANVITSDDAPFEPLAGFAKRPTV